jgi:hypothetical protein
MLHHELLEHPHGLHRAAGVAEVERSLAAVVHGAARKSMAPHHVVSTAAASCQRLYPWNFWAAKMWRVCQDVRVVAHVSSSGCCATSALTKPAWSWTTAPKSAFSTATR